jgi:excinuclease ABC subunit B
LREGLDIPECGLVAILDADKEGFLRSQTSLVQTIGRAARNSEGRVILYANNITRSMEAALSETKRRRQIQEEHNMQYNITPVSTERSLSNIIATVLSGKSSGESGELGAQKKGVGQKLSPKKMEKQVQFMRKEMLKAAKNLEFERASKIRDEIREMEKYLIELL